MLLDVGQLTDGAGGAGDAELVLGVLAEEGGDVREPGQVLQGM